MHVQDLMIKPVKTCGPDETLDVAARLMWENDFGCLPVTDDENHPIAMLTDRDICMAAFTQGRSLSQIRVRTAMSNSLYAAESGETVASSEERMRRHQVRRLPVVDPAGRLVGMLSLNDIAREAQRERPQRRPDVTGDEVAATLASVCRPRVCTLAGHEPAAAGLAV